MYIAYECRQTLSELQFSKLPIFNLIKDSHYSKVWQ